MTRGTWVQIIGALGIVEILTWGSTVYLLAVLGPVMVAQSDWSLSLVSAGVSVGLLFAGLIAARVGHAIKRFGGRDVMMTGVGVLILGLCALSVATTPITYLSAWVVIGAGMAATLYEAAFSTITAIFRAEARRAITSLTLIGGFASTVCWPLSTALVDWVGWRETCLIYAGMHLVITLPLLWLAVPSKIEAEDRDANPSDIGHFSDVRFYLLAASGIGLGLVFMVMSVHLIGLLSSTGVPLGIAVGLAALIGPAQVAGRLLEMATGQRFHPLATMHVAVALVLVGLIALALGWSTAAALVLYGAGGGLYSIARGTVPLALFGEANYPVIMGRLALPMLASAAVAPILGAWSITRYGAEQTLWHLAAIALIPVAAAFLLHLVHSQSKNQ